MQCVVNVVSLPGSVFKKKILFYLKEKQSGKKKYTQENTGLLAQTRSISRTVGWEPGCKCLVNTGIGKSIILDPFCGAGTVPLVALQNNRRYLGIELNAEYIALAHKRIETVQPTLWSA